MSFHRAPAHGRGSSARGRARNRTVHAPVPGRRAEASSDVVGHSKVGGLPALRRGSVTVGACLPNLVGSAR
jgi:hypothetical protein